MFRPPYNQMLWRDASIQPPYFLSGNNLQVFPLRAHPAKLANFVDNYLNVVPNQVGSFKPAAPYVFLIVSSTSEAAQGTSSGGTQYGFVSQCNLMFSIPLLWFCQTGRRTELRDVVLTTPFLYTSDWSSLVIMRRIFGWSNVIGRFEPSLQPWQQDINAWNPVVTVKTSVVGAGWQAEDSRHLPLLQIEQQPRSSLFQHPPTYGESRRTLLDLGPYLMNNTLRSTGLLGGLFQWWLRLGLRHHPREFSNYMLRQLSRGRDNHRGAASTGIVNLKQFRDAEKQDRVCYQALLEAECTFSNIERCGLLGFSLLPFADPSGGFRVRLFNYPTDPIMETLGLIPTRWEKRRPGEKVYGTSETRGQVGNTELTSFDYPSTMPIPLNKPPVAVLEPVFPFFIRGAMTYSEADTLCWRLRDTEWRVPYNESVCTDTGETRTAHQARGYCKMGEPYPGGNLFNTSAGPAILEYSGPYRFFNTTTRTLPLLADREKLQKLCDEYLNVDPINRFEVWTQHVLLTINHNEQTISLSENMEDWAKEDLEYSIPVLWYQKMDGVDSFIGLAFFAPFSYSNSETGTTIMNNIFGSNQMMADLNRPPDPWMDTDGPIADRPLLTMWRDTNPSFRYPVHANRSVAVEIIQRGKCTESESAESESNPPPEADEGRPNRENCQSKQDLLRCYFEGKRPKNEQDLCQPSGQDPSKGCCEDNDDVTYQTRRDALEQFGSTFKNCINLKQIPEADASGKSVYRALVCLITRTERLHARSSIEDTIEVRLHHNPLLPISHILGLKGSTPEYGKARRPRRIWQGDQVEIFKPTQAHWYRKTYQSGQAINLSWQTIGDPEWHHVEDLEEKLCLPAEGSADSTPKRGEHVLQMLKFFKDGDIFYGDVLQYVLSTLDKPDNDSDQGALQVVSAKAEPEDVGRKWTEFRGWF